MIEAPGAKGAMVDWPVVRAAPNAEAALRELGKSWTIALATNARDSDESQIRGALARVGLNELVEAVFCFRRLGVKKPEPAFFERVLEGLGLEPSRVVMVGDSWEVDVQGAFRAGLRAVWYVPDGGGPPPRNDTPLIRDFAHLPQLLEKMAPFGDEEG